MAELERTYVVPLRRGFVQTAKYKRTNKAVKTLRKFLVRHMKVHNDDIKIGQYLNEYLWENGIRNPPCRVTITAIKDKEGIVKAELEGKKYKDIAKPLAANEEPSGLKEKLQAAIGKKDKDVPEEKPPEETEKKT